ncbi:MAG: polysaccharide pyruvyl transferase family protein [Prevotella sp.]|nr:polysaccharide pyruvyl transferase family protein [Prevotella sp.]
MKIKTITCHDVYNYGASLQAYALQTYLESLGHDVEIIDYKPPYLSGHYNLWAVNNPVYDKPFIKHAYLVAKLPGRLFALKRKRAFDRFTSKHLKLTKRYHSFQELEVYPPKADVYIAGSDQIWNTLFQNGRDKAFYLAFAPSGSIRISYAASFATPGIAEEHKPFLKKMLKGIDRISIRENSSLPLLSNLGRPDGIAVCDPVFLLTKEQWEFLIPKNASNEKKYLLVYDTEGSERIKSIAKEIAEKKNLSIYNVSAFRLKYADKNYHNAGPIEFLQLLHNASYIISNSFHATAFSLIFQKDFCVVNRSENINERMQSLLSDFKLSSRLVSEISDEILSAVNYNNIPTLLSEHINKSKKFLKEAIATNLL